MPLEIEYIEPFEPDTKLIEHYERLTAEVSRIPRIKMKPQKTTPSTAPNLMELEASSRRAILALAAPVLNEAAKATIRQFKRHIYDLYETEMAKQNIEYAQALTDYAQ